MSTESASYLSLNHQWSVHAHVIDNSINVYHALPLNLKYQVIKRNESPSPAHTSTKRNKHAVKVTTTEISAPNLL